MTAWLVLLVVVDVVYLFGNTPTRYMAPGLLLFAVYQVFVLLYTFNLSFTNAGDGHTVDREAAIEAILRDATRQVPDSEPFRIQMLERDLELWMLATSPSGEVFVGSATEPLAPAADATFDDTGIARSLEGFESLELADLLQRQAEVVGLEVPFPELGDDASLRTSDGRSALVFRSAIVYDAERDQLRNVDTGEVFVDNGEGNFVAEDGTLIRPGWQAYVGFDNFRRVIDTATRGGLVDVLIWNISFAVLSTVLAFGLGTFLAVTLNHPRMWSRRFYRAIIILPYAFPFFLSGLVWSGLLNSRFGFVNDVLLGGADIEWLGDPFLAKLSVLLLSAWFGYPYFLLVCTGALQAIPTDVLEAAKVDGATGWKSFTRVQLPLLLTATSPLLVAGFVFSFNDFNSIFMLTGGGPPDLASEIGAGETDILISLVFKKAFVDGNRDFGLASAFSVILFFIVAAMAIYLFRRSKRFEEVYQ